MSPFQNIHFHLPKWVIVVLIWAPFIMGSIGTWAVLRGADVNENNCAAVKGLRNDLVFVLRTLEGRRLATLKSNPTDFRPRPDDSPEVQNVKTSYNFMIRNIQDPDCP